jgi:hypothetical protein
MPTANAMAASTSGIGPPFMIAPAWRRT